MRRWQILSLLVILELSLVSPCSARVFILPGVFYTDEYGVVGSLAFIMEMERSERLETRLEYFGSDEGQVLFNIFIPKPTVEWTFEGRYQISEKDAFSPTFATNQSSLVRDIRRWTEIWGRCDFIKESGRYYGLQGTFKRFDFKGDWDGATEMLNIPSINAVFTEGFEYYGSLRVGIERRDNRYYSRSGYYALWQLDLGRTDVSGDQDALIRTQVDLRKYISLKKDWSTLALNFRWGLMHSDVPYFSQFKMGGSQSLRGFPLDRYYGDAFYLCRAEWRQNALVDHPSPLQWLMGDNPRFKDHKIDAGFVVFSDFGDLFRSDDGWWGLRQSIGVGLRAVFPPHVVAAIDVATPLDANYVAVYLDLRQSF